MLNFTDYKVNKIIGDVVMKILKTLAVSVTIVMLVISCAADSEKLRKESKKTYHWSPSK